MAGKQFHLFVAFYHMIVLIGLIQLITTKVTDKTILRIHSLSFRYLTNWNVILQILFFFLSLVNDFQDKIEMIKNDKTKLKKLLDFWFCTITTPTSLFVSVAFWVLCTYDRESVFPVPIDQVMSPWLNHALHTNIMVLVLLEIVLVRRSLPSFFLSFTTFSGFIISYGICLIGTYFEQSVWIYPVFGKVNVLQRVILMITFFVFSIFCLIIGRYLNSSFGGLIVVGNVKRKFGTSVPN